MHVPYVLNVLYVCDYDVLYFDSYVDLLLKFYVSDYKAENTFSPFELLGYHAFLTNQHTN